MRLFSRIPTGNNQRRRPWVVYRRSTPNDEEMVMHSSSLDQDRYFKWYLAFLRNRVMQISPELKAILNGNTEDSSESQLFACFLQALRKISDLLADKPEVALAEIAECLYAESIITVQHSDRAVQFVFISIGLLSMIYHPLLAPFDGLQLQTSGSVRFWRVASFPIADDVVNEPFVELLRSSIGLWGFSPMFTKFTSRDTPESATLSYYTLKTLTGISIELTESVTEHLALDVTQNTMKIFRFPSFCDLPSTTLRRNFGKCLGSTSAASQECSHLTFILQALAIPLCFEGPSPASPLQTDRAEALYRELLLTYRIIFGQHPNSWRSMSWPSFTLDKPDAVNDPLLRDLVSKPWRKQDIYTELQAGPAKVAYPLSEFLFFGYRLHALQDYVSTQAPNSLWSLLRDHRDN